MNSTVSVTLGSSALIVCNITLNTAIGPDLSALNYTWYHNSTNITNRSEILKRNNNTITTILNIKSVELSDTGVYKCRAGIFGNNLMKYANTTLCIKGIVIFDYF